MRPAIRCLLIAGCGLTISPPAAAQTTWTWTGAVNSLWSNANNWSPASVPPGGQNVSLIFGAAATTAMNSDSFSLNLMNFQAGGPAYSLSPNAVATFTFLNTSTGTNPQVILDTGSSVTFNVSLQLNNNFTVTGAGAGTLTLNGISGSGSLTMAAAGTLKVNGAIHTYADTFVTNGTLLLATGTAIPNTSNVTVSGGVFNTGGLSNTSGNHPNTLSVNSSGKFLVPSGTSDFNVTNLAMTGGTLDATNATAFTMHLIGSGAGITINQGTSNWTGGNGRIQNDTGSPLTIAAVDTLNAGFAFSSLGNNPNFVFNNGTVRLSNTGNTANITATNLCFLTSNDLSTNVGAGAFGTLGTGTITLNHGILLYNGPAATTAKPLTITGGLGDIASSAGGAGLTMTGVISESAAGTPWLVEGPFFSSATVTLIANNTYTGPTIVDNSAILAIPTIGNAGGGGTASPLGASSGAAGNLQIGRSGLGRGDLLLTGTSATYGTDRGATVGGLYTDTGGGGGGIGVQNMGTTLTWGGQITGSGSFIKTGAGTLVLTNGTNNYSGGTYVEAGTLRLGGAAGALPVGGPVNLLAGTLDMNGFNQSIGSLTGAAGTVVQTGGATLTTGSDNTSTTFAGNLLGGLLTKNGSGTFYLTSLGNTANMTLSAGTLRIDDMISGPSGFGALGTGMISLSNNCILLYGGGTAATAKPLTLTANAATVAVMNAGTNLTLSGMIGGSAGAGFQLLGSEFFGNPGTSTLTLLADNTYTGPTYIIGRGVVAVTRIANGGAASPIGASSSAPGNLVLGFPVAGSRGDLLLTGTNATYSTDRGAFLQGLYASGSGGGIGVQNAATTLTVSGQITSNGGDGSFIKTGAGTLVLSNPNAFSAGANNYAGATYVEAGRLMLGTALSVPPVGNVTVFSGAEFNTGGFTQGGGGALGTVTLSNGTFRIPEVSLFTQFYISKLVMNGGTLDGTGTTSQGGLTLNQPAAAITVNANSSWTGPSNFFVRNDSMGELAINIIPGVTLTSSASLAGSFNGFNPFRLTGGGTLYLTNAPFYGGVYLTVNQARLRMDDVTNVAPGVFDLTFDNGTLQYGGPTASTVGFTIGAGGGTVEIMNAGTTLTLTGAIPGTGPLTKIGPGTLVLGGSGNSFTGLTVTAGTVQAANDNTLGTGPVNVGGVGTLNYAGTTATTRSFNLNFGTLSVSGGNTLTMTGSTVIGGFMAGPGTFAMTGGTVLAGVTTASSAATSVTGAATLVNVTNGGSLSVAAGLATPIALTRVTNQGSGSITVGAVNIVNVSDFQTYGTLTLNPAVVGSGQFTELVNTGSSPLYFNGGSRTFLGTPATANFNGSPTFVAGIDLNGKNTVVAGGLFVNNGFVVDSSNGGFGTATIVADFGALVKGAGFFQNPIITQNGGRVQAGNSPGESTFGSLAIGPGGINNYLWQINNATGRPGGQTEAFANNNVSGWSILVSNMVTNPITHTTSTGNLTWTATAAPGNQFQFALETLLNPTPVGTDNPGPMANFDPTSSFVWPVIYYQGTYTGPTDSATLTADTLFDTSQFQNPHLGTFSLALDSVNKAIDLVYTPSSVPEPGTLVLVGAAAAGLVGWRRRGRPISRTRNPSTFSVAN